METLGYLLNILEDYPKQNPLVFKAIGVDGNDITEYYVDDISIFGGNNQKTTVYLSGGSRSNAALEYDKSSPCYSCCVGTSSECEGCVIDKFDHLPWYHWGRNGMRTGGNTKEKDFEPYVKWADVEKLVVDMFQFAEKSSAKLYDDSSTEKEDEQGDTAAQD